MDGMGGMDGMDGMAWWHGGMVAYLHEGKQTLVFESFRTGQEVFFSPLRTALLRGVKVPSIGPGPTRLTHRSPTKIEFSFIYHTLWRGSFPCRNDVG